MMCKIFYFILFFHNFVNVIIILTMEVVFTPVEPKVFPNTFLQGVVSFLSFQPSGAIDVKFAEKVSSFIKENFNLELTLSIGQIDNGFSIKNEEQGVAYSFSANRVGVKLSWKDYISFKISALPKYYPIFNFINDKNIVSSISSTNIRKVNAFPFKAKGDGCYSDGDFISRCLSSNLISNASDYSGSDSYLISNHFRELQVKNESGDYCIVFGTVPYDQKPEYRLLFLDISIDVKLLEPFTQDKLLEVNGNLFNAFCWSLSETTLNIMNKKD